MYRYFAWTSGEYMRGNNLLHIRQIQKLLPVIKDDCMISIQSYTSDAESLSCPIYFDIDRASLFDAYKDTTELVNEVRWELDIEPVVYFSGSKGFHVLVPHEINHTRCNEIARSIASKLHRDIDKSIYRTRGLIRLNNTVNTKSGLYKVNVTDILSAGLDKVLARAVTKYESPFVKSVSSKALDEYIAVATSNLPEYSTTERHPQALSDIFGDMTPCLRSMWNIDELTVGTRHTSVFILVNFMYNRGASRDQLLDLFSRHSSYKNIPREYTAVINSVTRKASGRDVGCVSGVHAEYLQAKCKSPCWFKDKYTDYIRSSDDHVRQERYDSMHNVQEKQRGNEVHL